MILVLVVSVLMAALAAGLIRVATAASVLEVRELSVRRAGDNAQSVAVMAEAALKTQLYRLIQTAAGSAEGTVNMHVPIFVGAEFQPIHWDYDLSTDAYGPDETGSADINIRLAGPPRERTLAGVAAERKGVMLDEYNFTVEIRTTGRSSMNATAHAVEYATQKVWVLSGPADSSLIVKAKAAGATVTGLAPTGARSADGATASANPAGSSVAAPLAATTNSSAGHAIPGGTLTMTSLSGNYIRPPVANVPDGTWTGDPEVVSGPTRYGMDRGDALYVYELRGVPPGTHGYTPNTTVLCTDNWRTSMTTFNRGTDTADFYEGPNHALNKRKGTPWYAVVAVRTPSAGEGLTLPPGTGQLVLPGGRLFALSALPDNSWASEAGQVVGPNGVPYNVTAQPYLPVDSRTNDGDGYIVDSAPGPNGTRPQADGPITATSTTTIMEGGYAQDLAANPNAFGSVAHHYSGSGPIQVGLLSVLARRNQLTVYFASGGASTVVNNSKHYTFEPDDPPQPGGPPPPPSGGCSDCPPPDPTIGLLGFLFVPGDIVLVPDNVDGKEGPVPPGK
jgi:hypothetical protein